MQTASACRAAPASLTRTPATSWTASARCCSSGFPAESQNENEYPAELVIDGVSGIFVCGMKLFRKFALTN